MKMEKKKTIAAVTIARDSERYIIMNTYDSCPHCNSSTNVVAKGERYNYDSGVMLKVYRCISCQKCFDVITDERKSDKYTYTPDLWWEKLPSKKVKPNDIDNDNDNDNSYPSRDVDNDISLNILDQYNNWRDMQ